MLSDFVVFRTLRGNRNAVALQIDVNALRAIRRALSRRLAARTERAAALDACPGEAMAAPLHENQRRENRRDHAAESCRLSGADHWIEPGVVAQERARRHRFGGPR